MFDQCNENSSPRMWCMASFHILDDLVESHACEKSPEIPSPEIGKCLTDKKDNFIASGATLHVLSPNNKKCLLLEKPFSAFL